MSVSKRESGSAVVFEAVNGSVMAFCAQGVCYVSPDCPSGVKSSVLTQLPEDVTVEQSPTQIEFLELLAHKSRARL